MKKTYIITKKQLDEVINSNLMFSTNSTPDYDGSQVSVTEPVDGKNYGDVVTGDDKANNMPPGLLQRLTARGISGVAYAGPIV